MSSEKVIIDAEVGVSAELVSPYERMPDLKDAKSGRTTVFHPAPVVEGMLASMLAQCKSSLDVVFTHKKRKNWSKLKNTKACYVLVHALVADSASMMEPYSEASLNHKHRLCRKMLNEMVNRLISNNVLEAKRMRNKKVTKFARDLVDFLAAFHVVLHDGTPREQRYEVQESFCG